MAPSADLAATQIRPIAGRRGQILHNLMLDRLNPRGRPRQPLYQLTTGLDVNVQSLGARADATSSRQQVEVIATARLDGVGEPQTFRARATSSYNTTESDYGSLVAQEDAIKRALNLIADELTVKIAAFFRNARAQT
jgi:LPS-assembly lipoprotein